MFMFHVSCLPHWVRLGRHALIRTVLSGEGSLRFAPKCALVLLLLALVGCAAQNGAVHDPAAEEYNALRRDYDASRTKEYADVSVAKAVKAAARIFELADGGYNIIVGKGGVIAHRERVSMESMLTGVPGDYWYVDVRPSGSGVVMRLRRTAEPDPLTSLNAEDHKGTPEKLVDAATMDPVETWLSELTDNNAVYGIFFKRMDWLLARNNYWLYCRAGEEYMKMEKFSGTLDALCLDAKDKRPGIR